MISPLLLHMADELCSNPVFNELSAHYTGQLNNVVCYYAKLHISVIHLHIILIGHYNKRSL